MQDTEKILEKSRKILESPVCNHCLGRQFGQLLSGYTNVERGAALRILVAMSIDKEKLNDEDRKIDLSNFSGYNFHNLKREELKARKCSVCSGLFENLDKIAGKILLKIKKYEFRTFLMGTKLSSQLSETEEALWERVGIDYCEPIKAEINRELGKIIEKRTKMKFDAKTPDVNLIAKMPSGNVDIQVNPLFIYGEYQKLVRGIPQTKWPSGKYKTSIEQIIAKPYMLATKGKEHKLHGCIAGDTKIFLNECSMTISELEKCWNGHEIVTFNEKNKRIEISKIEDFMKTTLETFRLKTEETGREIIVSREHPFYTPRGMVCLGDLKPGDLVAVNSIEPIEYSEPIEKIIVNEQKILETIEKYIPMSYKSKIINELKERNLLPLKTTSKNILTMTRILAFLFGDGNVRYDGKRDVGLEFYGTVVDLKEIQKDLRKMGFNSTISKRMGRKSSLLDYYGKERIIEGGECFRLVCYSKSLWTLLVSLGVPIGNKATNDFIMPKWIKEIDMEIKKEFLASLFGCEMDMPRLDKRKYNRKSFNTPRFSMNKIETKLNNMIEFMNDIKEMLVEFDVKTLKIRFVPYTTRKDGNKSIKVILDFNNNFRNLINLYSKINFRYCKEKESYSKYVLEYLLMKNYVISIRQELFNKALGLRKNGLPLSKIHENLDNKYVSKKDLWLWIHNKIKTTNIKIPNDFPDFNVWSDDATKGLEDGLVWETIEHIENVGRKTVYDLTISKNHNFFANGFLVSNCGREDIDARCLAWRPFVLEIIKPIKRGIALKKLAKKIDKKVRVRNLHFSNIGEVRKIKEARLDKTYRATIVCEKPITRGDLKKLKSLVTTIKQKTPTRVLHRRADRFRKRKVVALKIKFINKKTFEMTVRSEAGLYVKELISSDSGRTHPSVSHALGQHCHCIELDVVNIHRK